MFCFAFTGDIYTGLGDGRIVKITGDKMTTVCRTGKECGMNGICFLILVHVFT